MMQKITSPIHIQDIQEMAHNSFGSLVKAVVDIKKEVMIIGGEMHADEEKMLLEDGSQQIDLWGINIYPEMPKSDWIEFDSMINLRPSYGNQTRGVDNPEIQERIKQIVEKLIIQ